MYVRLSVGRQRFDHGKQRNCPRKFWSATNFWRWIATPKFPMTTQPISPSATTTTVTSIREEAITGTPIEEVELSTAEGYDDEQIRLMEEVCIVIDENDQPLRPGTKKECTYLSAEVALVAIGHLMSNINKGLLHRAFSLFLSNPCTKKLLLQQRASEKITFPNQWTNTCCSHLLHTTSELGYDSPSSIAGVKRAAQRKLDHEVGIKNVQVPTE